MLIKCFFLKLLNKTKTKQDKTKQNKTISTSPWFLHFPTLFSLPLWSHFLSPLSTFSIYFLYLLYFSTFIIFRSNFSVYSSLHSLSLFPISTFINYFLSLLSHPTFSIDFLTPLFQCILLTKFSLLFSPLIFYFSLHFISLLFKYVFNNYFLSLLVSLFSLISSFSLISQNRISLSTFLPFLYFHFMFSLLLHFPFYLDCFFPTHFSLYFLDFFSLIILSLLVTPLLSPHYLFIFVITFYLYF